jgi:hypothetical protein
MRLCARQYVADNGYYAMRLCARQYVAENFDNVSQLISSTSIVDL